MHGDLTPRNLLTHHNSTTLIDWGDATWAARILWHHLSWTLGRLRDPGPRPDQRHWTAPPYARLLSLLRFLADRPAEPWRSLVPVRSVS